jgi:hypothetical protein
MTHFDAKLLTYSDRDQMIMWLLCSRINCNLKMNKNGIIYLNII